jgi:CheY-like chemotaxis protein
MKVLVTDDNRDGADALSARLTLEGFAVYTAYSGAEAIALAEEARPSVVLLDIAMPCLDGYAVARQLRQTSWGRTARMIAISGLDSPRNIRQSQEAGFDYHLAKPLDFDTLIALLIDPDL